MKKNIIIIIAAILLTAISAASVFAIANTDTGKAPKADVAEPTQTKICYALGDNDEKNMYSVSKNRMIGDKTSVVLSEKSKKALPKSDDRTEYVDADGNNYFFSPDGELSGFIRSNDYELPLDEESVSTISAEEARAKADEHIIAVYGEDVLSAFDKCSVEDSLTGPLYIVTYEVKAGIDDIIDVCRCRVHVVKENGEVYGSALNFYYENKDFDLSELSDISKKDIEAFAEKEAKNVYGDTVKNIEIQGVQLICEDGIYKIRVAAAFNFTDKDGNDDYTDEIVFFPI